MKWSNYHNHCHYCDGKQTAEDHVLAAIKQGVISLGFSCHCPVPFHNNWSMKKEDINDYIAEIKIVGDQFKDSIQVYKSLEIDYIPEMISPQDQWIKHLNLDYRLGSVHFVGTYGDGRPWEIDGTHSRFLDGLKRIYHNDIKKVIKVYFELTRKMVRESCPDIIGHLDKIKMQNRGIWDEQANWYRNEFLQTLEEIRSTKAIVEINTRGIYKKLTKNPYPGKWELKQIHRMSIPVQINSDAHHPREITGNFREAAHLLMSIGFKELMILRHGTWEKVKFNGNGLIL